MTRKKICTCSIMMQFYFNIFNPRFVDYTETKTLLWEKGLKNGGLTIYLVVEDIKLQWHFKTSFIWPGFVFVLLLLTGIKPRLLHSSKYWKSQQTFTYLAWHWPFLEQALEMTHLIQREFYLPSLECWHLSNQNVDFVRIPYVCFLSETVISYEQF